MRFSYTKHAVFGLRVVSLPVVGLPDGLQSSQGCVSPTLSMHLSVSRSLAYWTLYNHPRNAIVVISLQVIGLSDSLQSSRAGRSTIIQRMHFSYTNHAIFSHFVVGLPVVGLSDALPLFNRCVSLHLQLSQRYALTALSYWPIRRCMTIQGMCFAYTAYPSMKLSYLLLRLLFISP